MKRKINKNPLLDLEFATKLVDNMPIPVLIGGINESLRQLERRGVKVVDWDDSERALYQLKMYGNKVCFLAAKETDDER